MQLLGNLAQREGLLAGNLHCCINHLLTEFAWCAPFVAVQYACQALGSVALGPVVHRLVTHLQQLTDVRYFMASLQGEQSQGTAAKVGIGVMCSHLLQCEHFVFVQGFAQELGGTRDRRRRCISSRCLDAAGG